MGEEDDMGNEDTHTKGEMAQREMEKGLLWGILSSCNQEGSDNLDNPANQFKFLQEYWVQAKSRLPASYLLCWINLSLAWGVLFMPVPVLVIQEKLP